VSAEGELGSRLRQIRGARSRQVFGAQLGVHRNTVERYEKGGRPPDAGYLRQVIERNPEWRFEWLLTGQAPQKATAANRAEQRAARYDAIDDEMLTAVIEAVEEFLVEQKLRIAAGKKAMLISTLYEDARTKGEVSRATVLKLVKLAA